MEAKSRGKNKPKKMPNFLHRVTQSKGSSCGTAYYLQRKDDVLYTEEDLRNYSKCCKQIQEAEKRLEEKTRHLVFCEKNSTLYLKLRMEISVLENEIQTQISRLFALVGTKIFQMYHIDAFEPGCKEIPP